MRKRKWMKAGACALGAVLIMGLYAGPAFAEWIGTGGARAYIINGQVQTGWQQIDGKWYYLNEQGAPQIGWVKDGEKQYFCTASGEMVSGVVWINGKTYYFGTPDSGEMATGVVSINGIPYTFENDDHLRDDQCRYTEAEFQNIQRTQTFWRRWWKRNAECGTE